MNEMIYVDENGKELRREPKGRGKPPKNAVKQADGNWLVHPRKEEVREAILYVDLDKKGRAIRKTEKGRGKPKPGYIKATEGKWAGHWVTDPNFVASSKPVKKTKTVNVVDENTEVVAQEVITQEVAEATTVSVE